MGTASFQPPPPPQWPAPYPPLPPRLHWGWVLALNLLTRSFFGMIWLLVQAIWIRRATGNTEPRFWAIVHLCALPFLAVFGFSVGWIAASTGYTIATHQAVTIGVEVVAGLTMLVVYVVAVYKVRAALEAPPICIPLGGVMTFFFGSMYFQYFLRDWTPMDVATATPYPQYLYPNVPPPV